MADSNSLVVGFWREGLYAHVLPTDESLGVRRRAIEASELFEHPVGATARCEVTEQSDRVKGFRIGETSRFKLGWSLSKRAVRTNQRAVIFLIANPYSLHQQQTGTIKRCSTPE